jgi:hypothetical protein
MSSTQRQAALRKGQRAANPKPYRFCTDGLRRLLRVVGEHANGLDHVYRARYHRERLCVGCEESDGDIFVPVLGWVCTMCHEVVDLVWEREIEDTKEACRKVELFIRELTGDEEEAPRT